MASILSERPVDAGIWTASDFLLAALLVGVVGGLFLLTLRLTSSGSYRAGIGSALAAALLIVWASGAVGLIGAGDHPVNLLFPAVLVFALTGVVAVRCRPAGMARVMGAVAAAHLLSSAIGAWVDPTGGLASAALATLGILAAFCFRRAASEEERLGSGSQGA